MSILKKPDPMQKLLAIQQQIHKLFEDRLQREVGSNEPAVRTGSAWTPVADLYETDDEIVISAEVPGLEAEDVAVEVNGKTITLRGERSGKSGRPSGVGEGQESAPETFHRLEREYGTFIRSFTLPDRFSRVSVETSCRDGVLHVRLRRKPAKGAG